MSGRRRPSRTPRNGSIAGQLELELSTAPGLAAGKVFTISPAAPFLDTLARALLSGNLPHVGGTPPTPAELADTQIYLPNRTACRAMADALLRASGNRAVMLPRLRPLGSAEEDALLLLPPEDEDGSGAAARGQPLSPAIGALERRMVLTQLILAWVQRTAREDDNFAVNFAATPAAAAELAVELMRLMDEAEAEGVDLRKIRDAMPERFAEHEQLSLSFLDIVMNAWPNYLAGRVLNPIDRRNRVMALETERLRKFSPQAPVIVAGSTGSIPVTAALMQAVVALPNGVVVLPGVDLVLDNEAWAALAGHPEHPQTGFYHLLRGLGAPRCDVVPLQTAADEAMETRLRFLSEALRPASTIACWPQYLAEADPGRIRDAFARVSLLTAPTEEDEAAAVALILREAAETPGKTAALITPDRTLARRVSAELGRWGLAIPSAAAEPLHSTPAGAFYDLIAEAAATGSQIALLGVLKHPYTCLGVSPALLQDGVRVLEIAGFRQPWCGEGLDALSRSLHLTKGARQRHASIELFTEEQWNAAADLLHRLKEALWPLTQFARASAVPFGQLAAAHAETAQQLARDESGETPAFTMDATAAAVAALVASFTADIPAPSLPLTEYPALFRSLIKLERGKPLPSAHPRLAILTPAEARLIATDLVILAGLNEGTWPEAADSGPWLNRAIRAELGLPAPERRIRFATHDFSQAMGAPEVVLTRALKSEGTPTVPSRWLTRIETLLNGLGLADVLAPKRPWLEWAAARNTVAPCAPIKPPTPRPPVAVRPRRLSMSDIEALIANPYTIFARRILGLFPLEPLESEPDGDERGRIIHETLHFFARAYETDLPSDMVPELMTIFDDRAALFADRPRVAAFWRPRLERFARWFAEGETERRRGALVYSEVSGRLVLPLPGGDFTITTRADRIDLHLDGELAIYDYKTGSVPKETAVANFEAPQLPLEALIAMEGGFNGIARAKVRKLAYISAQGGQPAGKEAELKTPAADLASGARDGLTALINRFDIQDTPYVAMRRAAFAAKHKYDAYAHLARVAEWIGANAEDDA